MNHELWNQEMATLKEQFDRLHSAREQALKICRSIIQVSSMCIKHVHRRQFERAEELQKEALDLVTQARNCLQDFPELRYAGYLQDAEKEVVEASALIFWVKPRLMEDDRVVSSEILGVSPASYLNGIAEAASECRRYVLDEMRNGNLVEAERLLRLMETVYDDLILFDYPDALTGGLRRTCDALRAVLERTRSDLTMTCVQDELVQMLKESKSTDVII